MALIFGVDPRTVTKWARTERLPSVLTPGGQRRYRVSDVQALLEGAVDPPGSSLSDEDAGVSERGDEP